MQSHDAFSEGAPMLYGVIDIGSNTIRLTVYEVDERNRTFSAFFKLKTMAGLVSYIDKKTSLMSKEGIERLIEVCEEYLACAAHFKDLDGPYAFATAGVRNAKNADAVIKRVEKACGMRIDLISGREEAELGYVGAMCQSSLTTGVQIDVGGGSVEVSTFRDGRIVQATSVPQGSLSLFGSYVHNLLPTPAESDRIREAIRSRIRDVKDFRGFSCATASAVGGSARAARRLRNAWYPDRKDAPEVTREEIALVLDRASYDPYAATRDILRVVPERAHTCIPGLLVIETVMDEFGASTLEISDFGVREGYLLTRVFDLPKDARPFARP